MRRELAGRHCGSLTSGSVVSVVVPVSLEFQSNPSRRGAGRSRSTGRVSVTRTTSWRSLSLASVYVPMIDMYPRRIGIYISRLAGGSATPLALVPMFAGIVDQLQGSADGLVTLGFFEIQQFLTYRLIRST